MSDGHDDGSRDVGPVQATSSTPAQAEDQPSLDELMEPWNRRDKIGGSKNGFVNCMAANQVLAAIWRGRNEDEASKEIRDTGVMHRVIGIAPADVVEGMLAAQMVATHDAAMECFRRAHLPEQTFAGREMGLNHANKLVRSFAALTEALNRHRGKGQQTVRVEHVTVHAGGQAIVGAVTQGVGGDMKSEDRPDAKQLAHAPEPALRGQDPERETVPLAGGER